MRSLTAASAVAALVMMTRPAHAADAADMSSRCVPAHAIGVHVAVHEDPAIAPRVEREIASELKSTPTTPCWRTSGSTEGPTIHIEVRWPDRMRARVVIVATTQRRAHYGIRDLDLQKLPADGIPLAIAIAADELLETIGEQVAQEREEQPPAPRALPRSLRTATVSPPRPPTRRLSFGPALALDIVGSDLALVGPDTQMGIPLAGSLALGLHVGARAPIHERRSESVRAAGAWIAGASLRLGSQSTSSAFAASAGLDVMAVKLTASSDSVTETLGLARVGLGAYTTIAPGLRLTADAYVGGVLAPARTRIGGGPAKLVGQGLALGGALGLVAQF